MAKLPPEERIVPAGTELWRIYFQGGPHPTTWDEFRAWGPAQNARFDQHLLPPAVQSRAIVYGATDLYTCFAEVFQTDRTIARSRRAPWLVGFETVRAVAALDLTGTWPTRAGASMALNTGQRDRARRWSLRIYEDYAGIEGLYYPSSMNANKPALALYERAESCMPGRPTFHRALADPGLDGVVARAKLMFLYDVEP